ncbi:MBL fold metallo-hydrolase [Fusibacter ferrireducens]|uniref:MBL fold metallo-hydrolase n=1 Tax=Fusibacter ferrireducens TaxID=2785058 RepID=A0ABR9ZQ95_9FIRM|nr:MBL fold metallo-hydrolase [Fusibacter ferrireducens]MBF4692100.1 MBL fold metallo-hydrolase [Fusibacter ferrireducens]
MEIVKVFGNTYCIDTGMTYIPFYKLNAREIVLLDSGYGIGEREGINALIDDNGYHVYGIINSHAHIDHVGNNMFFKEKDKAIIAMTRLEAALCSSEESVKAYFGGHTLKSVRGHFETMITETDILIDPEDECIEMGGAIFKIIPTPGHSPAHISIITPDDVVYVGDTLISYEVMQGAKMPYAFILSVDFMSKKKLAKLNCEHFIVAHKGIYSNIENLVNDNIAFYKQRAQRVYDVVHKPMTLEEILRAVIREFNINVRSIHKQRVINRMMCSFVDYLIEIEQLKAEIDNGFIKYHQTERASSE